MLRRSAAYGQPLSENVLPVPGQNAESAADTGWFRPDHECHPGETPLHPMTRFNCKPEYRCGFPAKNARQGAPMLELSGRRYIFRLGRAGDTGHLK
jgi:hypothetical protein